jgi:TolA-binding protein
MKLYVMLGTVLLACGSMLGQSTQPSQAVGQPVGTPSDMQMGSTQKSKGMADMKDHKDQMQAEMQQMKRRIEKMRSDAEKVQDPNTKAALLDNADMWEHFSHHMQSHMDMMMKGNGMHKMGMMAGEGDMKDCPMSHPSPAEQTGSASPK